MSDATLPRQAAPDYPVISQLLALLQGGQAHARLDEALADFPADKRGVRPESLPYSAWQLVEHLRIAQRDILDFCNHPASGYHALKWPDAFWPEAAEPPAPTAWEESVTAIREDAQKFQELLMRPGADLYTPFPWGDGQNLLREALLIADHNAYHTGELIVLRRLLGIWPGKK